MGGWLTRIRESWNGEEIDVRATVARAQDTRARVELTPEVATAANGGTLVTQIERVDDRSIVVIQPTANGAVRPLARFESYAIAISTPVGRVHGKTRTLGRVKIRAADGGTLYGYRLALPERFDVRERRSETRILLGAEAREAELHVLSHKGAIHGLVADISAGGARLLCRNAGDHLEAGALAYFKLELPAPVGAISETVVVLGVDPVEGQTATTVRVAFEKRNVRIADAIRLARRQGAA
ncbi:MAG: hypothetical protein HKO59_02950 [Phycisphaerales bacterium]|nr:hypothetical protein [Phycisphaerae bacterium]NNF44876.1 hypothetical protein [Phycisphaerales bacterium]NNM24940.1 hypothetical protein [Phycisphaerales bacterium]